MSLGKILGGFFYYFDFKHKAVAYANIKTAFGDKLSVAGLRRLTRGFFQAFGQNLIDIFMIPLADKEYIRKFVSVEGGEHVEEALKKGKGVILLGVHEGSWELSNAICGNLGFPFVLFVRGQKYPRLEELLNTYRLRRGCKIIQRRNDTRQLIEALRDNQVIGMTADQGGKNGIHVQFFGRDATFAQGAVRLALKYGTTIIPGFYVRTSGPHIKVILEPAFALKNTGDLEQDIQDNLQALARTFEKYILRYPREYLWTYKVWKYSRERRIVILTDDKTGHLRQSQAAAKILGENLLAKGVTSQVDTLEIKFKSEIARSGLALGSCLAGRYNCQGCLGCLKKFLAPDVYAGLASSKPDAVISCGSSLALVNYIFARENSAKSIVIMRPSFLGVERFDLAIIPRHDQPPQRKNIVVTQGALNLIDEQYLKDQTEKLLQAQGSRLKAQSQYIGLLIGGDTKKFKLNATVILEVIAQIKIAAEELDASILVTTSRRTSREVEEVVKNKLRDYPRCKLLVIANEKNIPEAVGGILGLSQIIVTSAESISMVSEAVSSQRYVLVFKDRPLGRRHQKFIQSFSEKKFIYLSGPRDLGKAIRDIWSDRPAIPNLEDSRLVREALNKIL
jgi:KDO2-lipid IV(A) lauroyltransferase